VHTPLTDSFHFRESTIGTPKTCSSCPTSLTCHLLVPFRRYVRTSPILSRDLTVNVAAFLTQTVTLDDSTNIKFEIWDTVCRS